MNVLATKDSEPTVQRSFASSQIKVLFVESPRSISIPPFSLGVPVALLLSKITLSARLIVSVFTVVVVPETVRLPLIVKPANVGESPVPTPKSFVYDEPSDVSI